MKRINYLMIAAFMAVSSMLVSCEKDENGSVVITLDATEIESGAAVNGEINSTNALKSVTLLLDGATVPGWPKTSFKTGEPVSGADGKYTIRITGLAAGTYSIRATDGDGVEDNKTFTVKAAEVSETALKAGDDFILKFTSNSSAVLTNEATGVKFDAITNSTTARFAVVATDGKFVKLADQAAFDALTTKEALKKAYDDKVAASGVANFTVESDAKFSAVFFISKVGNNYFLIKMTNLTFAAANNQAFFSYKF